MTKVFSSLVLLLLMTGSLLADNAKEDSLLSLIPRSQSRKKVELYLELSSLTIKRSATDQSQIYAKAALDIATDLNLPLQKAKALEAYALTVFYQSHYQPSLELLRNSYQLYSSTNNSAGMASCLNRMGNCYERLGNYLEALAAYQKALTIEQKLGDRSNVTKLMNNLGVVYSNLKDYSHAISLFQKAREIAIQALSL